MRRFLAPFAWRDYRLLWPADLFTALAFEMEVLILGWYVLVTTESVFWLSAIGALHYMGTLLSPGVGVIADRIGLRNTLCLMRAFYTAMAGTLAFLFLTDQATLPLVFAVAALLGAIRPSDVGMRSALVALIVPSQQLAGAIALSRTTFDGSRIVGALMGAGTFAVFGIGTAYILVTTFYFVGCLLTVTIRPRPSAPKLGRPSPIADLAEGFKYIWRTPHIQAGMWLACLVNLTAFPQCLGLLPYVAKEVYRVDETGLGLLMASFAMGALFGSILLAMLRNTVPLGRMTIIGAAVWHLSLLALAFTTTRDQGIACLYIAGFAQSLSMLSLSSMLLRTSDVSLFGRVMGVRMLAIYTLPMGLLLAGVLIPVFGFVATAATYATTGLILTFAIAFCWRRSMWSDSSIANA